MYVVLGHGAVIQPTPTHVVVWQLAPRLLQDSSELMQMSADKCRSAQI